MKVDGRTEAGPSRPAPDKARFQQELHRALAPKAPPRPSPSSPRPLPSPGAVHARVNGAGGRPLAGAAHLGQVRQGLNAEAHRLADVRGAAHETQHERVHQRVKELLARELLREEPRASPPEPRGDTPRETSPAPREPSLEGTSAVSLAGPGGARPPAEGAATPEARVQATLELIERLELFVKSHRPALALQLGGGWDARVEVERTGVGEVALRIQGRRGPLPAREVERLREALRARGLQLRALHNG